MPDPRPSDPQPPRPSGGGWAWIALIAGVAAQLGWLASEYGEQFDWESDGPRLAYLLLLLALVASSLIIRRTRLGGALRALLAWAMIGTVIVIGYSYRHELKSVWYRVVGEIDPSRPTPVDTGSDMGRDDRADEGQALAIRASSDGHYYVTAAANGAEMRLLVDTGATVTVLSLRQAERAGIFPNPSDYTVQVRTASGMAKAAPVRIRELRIGDARLEDVPALVMQTPGDLSVIGVNTLQRFRSYEVRNGVLTLRW